MIGLPTILKYNDIGKHYIIVARDVEDESSIPAKTTAPSANGEVPSLLRTIQHLTLFEQSVSWTSLTKSWVGFPGLPTRGFCTVSTTPAKSFALSPELPQAQSVSSLSPARELEANQSSRHCLSDVA